MDNEEKREKIEYYIGKLQSLLTNIISNSDEFKELKKLTSTDNSELQFCIFSIMTDKKNINTLKDLDIDILQQMIMEAQSIEKNPAEVPQELCWTEDDRQFLKDLRIIL